jgi:hypothetical protein
MYITQYSRKRYFKMNNVIKSIIKMFDLNELNYLYFISNLSTTLLIHRYVSNLKGINLILFSYFIKLYFMLNG